MDDCYEKRKEQEKEKRKRLKNLLIQLQRLRWRLESLVTIWNRCFLLDIHLLYICVYDSMISTKSLPPLSPPKKKRSGFEYYIMIQGQYERFRNQWGLLRKTKRVWCLVQQASPGCKPHNLQQGANNLWSVIRWSPKAQKHLLKRSLSVTILAIWTGLSSEIRS